MNKIELSDEQLNAIQLIEDFILNSKEIAFSLTGAAGTGKTLIMNTLVKKLEYDIPIVLCAPTHKATLVLEKVTDRECITLHSLLALTPNLDIFDLDFRDLLFKTNSDKNVIPREGLVICDEASMINDDLFNILIKKCSERKTKILFLSDSKQLRPVKSEQESLVYSVKNQFNLTKIFRQSDKNAILPILCELRDHSIDYFTEKISTEGSLYCIDQTKDFLIKYISKLKKAINNSDILETKLAAYTNKRVDKYNEIIKKALWKDNNEYHKFEFLTGCENIEFNKINFWNSMDYIISSDPIKVDINIPYFMKLPGYSFELYDSVIKSSNQILILSKEISQDYFNSLSYKIEDIRTSAIKAKYPNRSKLWGMYYKIIKSFTTPINLELDGRLIKKKSFTEGYSCSVHKLQGSSFNSIFIDMKNINSCFDNKIKQQLQYVALSRTRKDAFILQ